MDIDVVLVEFVIVIRLSIIMWFWMREYSYGHVYPVGLRWKRLFHWYFVNGYICVHESFVWYVLRSVNVDSLWFTYCAFDWLVVIG